MLTVEYVITVLTVECVFTGIDITVLLWISVVALRLKLVVVIVDMIRVDLNAELDLIKVDEDSKLELIGDDENVKLINELAEMVEPVA